MEHLKSTSLGVGSGLTRNYWIRMDRLAVDKHSSFVSSLWVKPGAYPRVELMKAASLG
jgi:hypothetical protein